MHAGVATRRDARIPEPIGKALTEGSTSTGRSVVSRRFVKETEPALAELLARDLTGKESKVLMLDGEHVAGRCVIVALGITAGGEKFPVGLGRRRRALVPQDRGLPTDALARRRPAPPRSPRHDGRDPRNCRSRRMEFISDRYPNSTRLWDTLASSTGAPAMRCS